MFTGENYRARLAVCLYPCLQILDSDQSSSLNHQCQACTFSPSSQAVFLHSSCLFQKHRASICLLICPWFFTLTAYFLWKWTNSIMITLCTSSFLCHELPIIPLHLMLKHKTTFWNGQLGYSLGLPFISFAFHSWSKNLALENKGDTTSRNSVTQVVSTVGTFVKTGILAKQRWYTKICPIILPDELITFREVTCFPRGCHTL